MNQEENSHKRRRIQHDYSQMDPEEDDDLQEYEDITHIDQELLQELTNAAAKKNKSRNTNKNQRRSSVWKHFSISPINRDGGKENDQIIKCNYCDTWSVLESCRHNSTSNMHRHLERDHRDKMVNESSISTPELIVDKKKQFYLDIVRLIVMENLPFCFIESPYLKHLFSNNGVEHAGISAKKLKKLVESEFKNSREQLKHLLLCTCNSIAISVDAWTSPHNNSFIGIIGSWIGPEFELYERVLDFKSIQGCHTGSNMAEHVIETLNELDLLTKLLTITSDNAKNNDTLSSSLVFSLKTALRGRHDRTIRYQGTESLIRCLAHIINLVVKAIMSVIKAGARKDSEDAIKKLMKNEKVGSLSAIMKVRTMALYIRGSTHRKNKWLELVTSDQQKKLIDYDVDTRWNSTFKMIDDVFRFPSELNRYATDLVPDLLLSSDDWIQLTNLRVLLKTFDDFTNFLSTQKPQIVNSLAVYYALHDLLNDVIGKRKKFANLTDDLVNAVKLGKKKYDKYYSLMDSSLVYYITATLDPRTKAIWIDKHLNQNDRLFLTREVIERIKLEYNVEDLEEEGIDDSPPSSDYSLNQYTLRSIETNKAASDVDRYYKTGSVEGSKEKTNLEFSLEWWRDNQQLYPVMSLVARDYLAIPAATVSVERLFNQGRDVIQVRRHSMKDKTFRWVMLLKDHYRHCHSEDIK